MEEQTPFSQQKNKPQPDPEKPPDQEPIVTPAIEPPTALTRGQMCDLVKKLGGEYKVLSFLAGAATSFGPMEVQRLVDISGGQDAVREMLEWPDPDIYSYELDIDGTRSIKQMLRACHFGWVNDHVCQRNFPMHSREKRTETVWLVPNLQGRLQIPVMTGILERLNLRPAYIEHLLAFAQAYPMFQFRHNVLAFGTRWAANRRFHWIPCLDWVAFERRLILTWYEAALARGEYGLFIAIDPSEPVSFEPLGFEKIKDRSPWGIRAPTSLKI